MSNLEGIFNILPQTINASIKQHKNLDALEEIRIKINSPLIFQISNSEIIEKYVPTNEDLATIFKRISNYSIYAFDEDIKKGFITVKGGHRVGICGACVVENNNIKTIRNISSINIRISKEIFGCSDEVLKYIFEKKNINNTVIISPPKCGKTTILRDIARNISDSGSRVCIVDERSELACCYASVPQMNVGVRTDVLDACPKNQGIMMAIRSMSPDVIVCDEIGTTKDIESIVAANNCGVNIITSIHGSDIEDLAKRKVFCDMFDSRIFKRAILLNDSKGPGTIGKVIDLESNEVLWGK